MTMELPGFKIRCPLCDSLVNESTLGILGLTKEELAIAQKYIKEKTFGRLVRLADAMMPKLNPDRINQEIAIKSIFDNILQAIGNQGLSTKTAFSDIDRRINEMRERIVGPGIGKLGQIISIKDLKSLVWNDDFTEEKADSHGTDIIATAKENKILVGKIAISVKYDTKWQIQFINQLQNNMKHENTNFGILVSKSFPEEALNDKAYAREGTNGEMILLVKPEYAPVAYYGFRQAVIARHEADKIAKTAETRLREQSRILNAVVEWLNGQQFRMVINMIDSIRELSEETDSITENLWNYVEQKIKRIQKVQKDLRYSLSEAKLAVEELKELLKTEEEEKE